MNRIRLVVVLLLFSIPTQAAPLQRALFNFGPWIGGFNQGAYSHTTDFATRISAGFGLQVGWDLGGIFIDYAMTWMWPQHFLRPGSDSFSRKFDDAAYWSLAGINVGTNLAGSPFEAYLGVEWGTFGFSTGSNSDYSGYTGKAGVGFNFADSAGQGGLKGARLEYRRMFVTEDDAGRIPDLVSTNIHSYFLALSFGYTGRSN